MNKNIEPKVGVLGAGAWGTTIAQLLSKNNSKILIWAKEHSVVNSINTKHINNLFLPNIKLSNRIKATSSLEEFNNINFLFVVIPVQYISSTLKKLKKIVGNDCVFINASKGIEIKSLKLVSHLINDAFPKNKIAILSGPNFAKEIANGKPTASLIAANSLKKAKNISELISSKYFRPYLSDDILGAQICGAMKNVYAIGCGIIEGKQFGENAAASIMSRGFAEIKLVCKKLGGETETLIGLSGLGDLFLTCSSNKSRNFSLGLNLAKGKNFENLLKSKKTIAEGAYTVKAIQRLSKKLKIHLPLNDAIYKILYQNKNIDKTINELLNRPIRTER